MRDGSFVSFNNVPALIDWSNVQSKRFREMIRLKLNYHAISASHSNMDMELRQVNWFEMESTWHYPSMEFYKYAATTDYKQTFHIFASEGQISYKLLDQDKAIWVGSEILCDVKQNSNRNP